ncbi:MAG: hypothetical protein JW940_03885 [Polyangiaceae bacterium]|nr:hypothetical protein [Polyangiaceae bacterium]
MEPRKPRGGATFVLSRLANAATYVRQRPHEAVALVIVIDGDDVGLQGRLREIAQRLDAAGFDARKPDERIARCVPSRNVETWELWLSGRRDLNESTDYKREAQPQLGTGSRDTLVEAWLVPLSPDQQEEEQAKLPALTHARHELARLRQARAHH